MKAGGGSGARDRLLLRGCFAVSIAALVVAVLGTTPLAEAALDAVLPRNSVGTAQLKPSSVTSSKVRDGSLTALDFKTGQLPAGAPGPAGPQGASGPRGLEGPRGPAGPTDTSKLLGRTVIVAAYRQVTRGGWYDYVRCPAGYEATGGGAFTAFLKAKSVGDIVVLESSPLLESGATPSLGTGPAATAWGAKVWVAPGADVAVLTVTWYVVCAKAGA